MSFDQFSSSDSLDDVLAKLRAFRENSDSMVAYPRVQSSDSGRLVELTLTEDGRVEVSIRRELFGLDGNPSAVERAIGEAVESFLHVSRPEPGDERTYPEAMKELNDIFAKSRQSALEQMSDVEDYVASMKAKIEQMRARR